MSRRRIITIGSLVVCVVLLVFSLMGLMVSLGSTLPEGHIRPIEVGILLACGVMGFFGATSLAKQLTR
jgi:hypothetical protein